MLIRSPQSWEIPEGQATPESVYWDRRRFIRALGLGSLSGAWLLAACAQARDTTGAAEAREWDLHPPGGAAAYPAKRNTTYDPGRGLTPESISGRYNNFYEFTTDKSRVWELARGFQTRPWTVKIHGLVHKPMELDVDDLVKKLPLEERLYRFRCVEAWSMTVPWTGFPLKELVKLVQPKAKAKYIRFVSFEDKQKAPGQKSQPWYPWPYHEALRLDEAMNDLTMGVTGIYGHALSKQHGAPLRIITPWKYGYKSAKSIVEIQFVKKQPGTFWQELIPEEYGFYSNVDPEAPHPRWSQATERLIDTGERIPTRRYNSYGEQVAALYKGLRRGPDV